MFQRRIRNHVYLSKRFLLTPLSSKDLPLEHLEMPNKATAMVFKMIDLSVPVAYIYILLLILSEMTHYFPESVAQMPLFKIIVPILIKTESRPYITTLALLETLFYIFVKVHIFHLQRKCPLEYSLKSAPLQTLDEREILWTRLLKNTKSDPVSWISGWFFDVSIDKISLYDMMDFLTWSMFEGRSQEHLTTEEIEQLERFLVDVEKVLADFLRDEGKFHEIF